LEEGWNNGPDGWKNGWKQNVNCGATRGKKLEKRGKWLMDQRERLLVLWEQSPGLGIKM
jgi:hypothetical protein